MPGYFIPPVKSDMLGVGSLPVRKMPPSKIPHVEDCIAYIESCGWKLAGRNAWLTYFFVKVNPDGSYVRRENGSKESVTFNIREIRDAYKNGW